MSSTPAVRRSEFERGFSPLTFRASERSDAQSGASPELGRRHSSTEAECEYISSRGFMGLCDVRPFIDRANVHEYDKRGYLESACSVCGVLSNVVDKAVLVYVCSDVLGWFVDEIIPRIRCPFVIVSGDSDALVPREVMTDVQVQKVVECGLCRAWYAQNWVGVGADTQKVMALPIGMDYHTLSGCAGEWGAKQTPGEQEAAFKKVAETASEWRARQCAVYCNVQFRLDRWGDRERAIREVLYSVGADQIIFASGKMAREAAWREMAKYRYILSPFGNGYDCHRTWEALLLGCVPIVCCHGEREYKKVWDGLPVLCVDKWSDVTPTVLANFDCNLDEVPRKLGIKWWRDRIHAQDILH